MVTLAAAAAARPALACTVTLQLSPGADPSQGEHCCSSHAFKVAWEKKKRGRQSGADGALVTEKSDTLGKFSQALPFIFFFFTE